MENKYHIYIIVTQTGTIVARLIKKDYKEFINKKNKFTKVLNVEFIDKMKMRITGAMFGDYA